MKTIALRFADHFAPECGTIAAHEQVIKKIGHVWYGKLGNKVSDKMLKTIMDAEEPKILLIRSGKVERYWAYVCKAQNELPDLNEVPMYYRNNHEKFHTWFCVTRFDNAPKSIMSECIVTSSGALLGHASKYSMSPYFIIETKSQYENSK